MQRHIVVDSKGRKRGREREGERVRSRESRENCSISSSQWINAHSFRYIHIIYTTIHSMCSALTFEIIKLIATLIFCSHFLEKLNTLNSWSELLTNFNFILKKFSFTWSCCDCCYCCCCCCPRFIFHSPYFKSGLLYSWRFFSPYISFPFSFYS